MKKLVILLTIILSTFLITSCSNIYSGFTENHSLKVKKVSSIATVKGGRSYCKH